MKAMTLRNLPSHLDRAIQQRARSKKTSVNKAVISLLEEHLGSSSSTRTPLHHDLDDLSGLWTREEAARFDKNLVKQRTIDPSLWK